MKLFKCQNCGQVVYFENIRCEQCSYRLGYLPETNAVSALDAVGDQWRPLRQPDRLYCFCANAGQGTCNWLVAAESQSTLCAACVHNHTIPNLNSDINLRRWTLLELAKHRLFYSLLRLRLPLKTRTDDPEHGLAFDFLEASPNPAGPKILTGHDNGLITIALEEADDVERERRRTTLHEPYRSLLGHFRHESGHYFWDVLIKDHAARLEECRAIFGDDRQDYGAALQAHYQKEPSTVWQDTYVSAYAASHPWEDWAETWAHYLHIVDTVEMASSFGIRIKPRITADETLSATIALDPYETAEFKIVLDAWLPLTFAVNSLNRAMGQADLYPFVLSPPVIQKLEFVHRTIRAATAATAAAA